MFENQVQKKIEGSKFIAPKRKKWSKKDRVIKQDLLKGLPLNFWALRAPILF